MLTHLSHGSAHAVSFISHNHQGWLICSCNNFTRELARFPHTAVCIHIFDLIKNQGDSFPPGFDVLNAHSYRIYYFNSLKKPNADVSLLCGIDLILTHEGEDHVAISLDDVELAVMPRDQLHRKTVANMVLPYLAMKGSESVCKECKDGLFPSMDAVDLTNSIQRAKAVQFLAYLRDHDDLCPDCHTASILESDLH